MDANGGNQTRLTANLDKDLDPAWSPDGSKLAFMSGRGGSDEVWDDIYVMDADGSNPTKLTSNTNHFGPAWSPRP